MSHIRKFNLTVRSAAVLDYDIVEENEDDIPDDDGVVGLVRIGILALLPHLVYYDVIILAVSSTHVLPLASQASHVHPLHIDAVLKLDKLILSMKLVSSFTPTDEYSLTQPVSHQA